MSYDDLMWAVKKEGGYDAAVIFCQEREHYERVVEQTSAKGASEGVGEAFRVYLEFEKRQTGPDRSVRVRTILERWICAATYDVGPWEAAIYYLVSDGPCAKLKQRRNQP